MNRQTAGKSREQGSALVEFTLCVVFFWMPLFAGLVIAGTNLIRGMQVTQVCRDAGHMFAFGADFTQPSYQNLLVNLAPSLGLSTTATASHGVVIFSQITLIDDTCDGTSTKAKPVTCTNDGYYVVVKRIVVGNPALQSSQFGTPDANVINATTGEVSQNGYLNNSSTRAYASGATAVSGVSFAPPIVLPVTQYAYAAEMYVTSPQGSSWSVTGPPSVAAQFIF
jgi:hypothetical protein